MCWTWKFGMLGRDMTVTRVGPPGYMLASHNTRYHYYCKKSEVLQAQNVQADIILQIDNNQLASNHSL